MADYTQTHVVPTEGLPAWNQPDGSGPPAATLDPGLDVQVIESRADWAHVRCSNGWEAWVDGRRLVESQPAPTPVAAPPPPSPTPPPQQAAPPPTPQAPPATQPVPQAAPPTQPGPPSAVWAAPAVADAPRAGGGFRIGPGQIVALAGGALLFVSGWFRWLHLELEFAGQTVSKSATAYTTPAHFLLDSSSELGGLSLGILIAFLGVACIAASLISAWKRRLSILSVATGGVAVLVIVLFLVQTKYAVNDFNGQVPKSAEMSYFDALRYGAIVALLGAIATLVGGILALVLKRS